jgi:hypothetical protein
VKLFDAGMTTDAPGPPVQVTEFPDTTQLAARATPVEKASMTATRPKQQKRRCLAMAIEALLMLVVQSP